MSRGTLSFTAVLALVLALAIPVAASAHGRPYPPPKPTVYAEIGCAVVPGTQTKTYTRGRWTGGSVQVTCTVQNLSDAQLLNGAVTVPQIAFVGPTGPIGANSNASIGFGFTYTHGVSYAFVFSATGINPASARPITL